MKLCVTGATGFLGRYVVSTALSRGHSVRALVHRPADGAKLGWPPDADLEQVKVDLRSKAGLADAVRGCDAVLHLAATKAGDLYAQFGGTVVATENLLWAMQQADVRRIVAISSFAVYDYLHRWSWAVLDETSPLDEAMVDRDEYAQTKLIQEQLVRDTATKNGWAWTVLRPGMIYGRDNLFNARVGMGGKGRTWVRTGAWAPIPLTYVENCAEAIVLAAERAEANGQVLNIVDDRPPTQRRYAALLRSRTTPRPRIVPLNWTVLRTVARLGWLWNRFALGGKAKVPGLLVPARLHARCKPLRYRNDKIKSVLGWTPRFTLDQAVDRSLADGPPVLAQAMMSPAKPAGV
jgi:nucleoside-diphosphate-sugar epimerase